MNPSPLLAELVTALQYLPGIGPKSAQRIAFHLLQQNRDKALRLSNIMEEAARQIENCISCRTFTEKEKCGICDNPDRDSTVICVVENPLDVQAVENASDYRGCYFVLHGRLSPIDGMTPDMIGIPLLQKRLQQEPVAEIIVATGTTMEGEATAHFLKEIAMSHGVRATRIAHGVPLGGELEYVDGFTLSRAINSRHDY